ncbi:MAG: hypothetical protein SNH99_09095 [Rikenellaceae bacterium]
MKDNIVRSSEAIDDEGLYKTYCNFKLFQMDNCTDAVMLNIAAGVDSSKPVESAMMNYMNRYQNSGYFDLAKDTKRVVLGDTDGLKDRMSYARYWHGYQIPLRPLLVLIDWSKIRVLNFVIFAGLLFASIWLIRKKLSTAVAVIFCISLILINFPLVPLTMQFSTCFYLMFLGVIAILYCPKLTNSDAAIYSTFFAIGALTSFFDFLTTPQITLGFPMIIHMLLNKPNDKVKLVVVLSLVWTFGYGSIWASKWLVGSLLTGNNILADAMGSVGERSSNLYRGMEMTIPNIINFIWVNIKARSLEVLVYGAAAVIVVLGWIYSKVVKSIDIVKEYAYLLLIAMIVPVWFYFLRNHSIQHGWFTWRAIVLSIFSLLLFVYYTTDIKQLFKKTK